MSFHARVSSAADVRPPRRSTRDLEFNGVTVPAAQVHASNRAALEFAYGEVVKRRPVLLIRTREAGRQDTASLL